MKSKDYQMIQAIIMQDVSQNQIRDLMRLRNFLETQIELAQQKTQEVKPNSKEEHLEVLSLALSDFLTVKTYGIKFIRDDIIRAIKRLKNIKGTVLVAHSVGIGKVTLLQEQGIGPRTVAKYERALNQYGYSLDQPLSPEVKEKLKVYQKMS